MAELPGGPDPQPGRGAEPPIEQPVAPTRQPANERSGIGRASALLASGTIVSRILGFVKAIVLAAAVGQVGSEAGNAFGVANQLPNNIYALIAGGVLGAVLVPQIVRAAAHDDGGQRYINKIVTLGASAFVVIAVLGTLAAPLLIALYTSGGNAGEGFSPDGLALATAFAYWCLPQILFYALYSLLGEVLNARRSFGAFTWAPVINNVVSIAGLVAFIALFGGESVNRDVTVWDAGRITLLAGSATLGVAAQAFVLILFWRRAGLTYRPDFRWKGVGLARTGKAAGWTFGMILVTQVAGIFQTNVASLAASDGASVLALQNSWLIFMLPHSVIAVSLATAYFTRMSTHASRSDLTAVRADVASSLTTIGLFITFSSAALIVVAFPFARVFEAGGFDGVTDMALVIIAFVIGLVPFSAVFVMQRAFYSLEDTRTPFLVETVKAGVFIVGALACTLLPTNWIAVGIAMVTTIACVIQTTITFLLLRRRLGPFGGRLLFVRQAQYLLAAAIAVLIGLGIMVSLGGLTASGFAQSGIVPAIAAIAAVGAGMAVVYAAVLLLMKNPELTTGLRAATARLRRR